MPIALAAVAVGSAAATTYGAIEQNKAARNAAEVDQATAAYNARYDDAMAAQLDKDTQANITTERQNDAVYLSKQEASYASAGVLATSGSALHTQITNAGRMEQQIQQEWVNSQQKQAQYDSAAAVGQLEGQAQASADRLSGSIALINGAGRVASQLGSAYMSGVFSGGGGGGGGGGSGADGFSDNVGLAAGDQ